MRDILDILFPILTFGLFFAGIAAKARKKLSGDTGSAVSHSGSAVSHSGLAPESPESPTRRDVPLNIHSGQAKRESEPIPEEGARAIEHRSGSPTRRNVSPVAGEKKPAPAESIPAPQRPRALRDLSEAEKLIVYSEIMHPKFEEN